MMNREKTSKMNGVEGELTVCRVSLWEGRKPTGPADSQYTTGDESAAWASLCADLRAAGDGSWGKVEHLHGAKGAIYAVQQNGRVSKKRVLHEPRQNSRPALGRRQDPRA